MEFNNDVEFYKQQYIEVFKIILNMYSVPLNDNLKNQIIENADDMITEMAVKFNNYMTNTNQQITPLSIMENMLTENNRNRICRYIAKEVVHEAVKQTGLV